MDFALLEKEITEAMERDLSPRQSFKRLVIEIRKKLFPTERQRVACRRAKLERQLAAATAKHDAARAEMGELRRSIRALDAADFVHRATPAV